MKRALWLALAALASIILWAGSKKDKAGAGFGPTRLVTLNVSAEDDHGQPIGDLTQADFQLSDRSKPQTISVFRHNGNQPAPEDVAPLGPHEFSNRAGGIPPRVTLILFDLFNTRGLLTDQGYAHGQIIETLRKLESADYLYMYLLTVEGLLPIEPLPEPGEEPSPKSAAPWTQNIQQRLDTAFQHVYRMKPYLYTDDRVMGTFMALESLATRLGAVAGRKNIVWITNGVPIAIGPRRSGIGMPIDYEPVLQQLSESLDRAGVAMYPVDLSGPGMQSTVQAASNSPTPNGGAMSQPSQSQEMPGVASADTLEQIAGLTGGRAYVNTDIPGAIKQALRDARSSYLIGFYPPPGSMDGKLHKLKLKCSRKGVRLQTRTEYMAYPPAAAAGPEEQAALRAAIKSPFDASEIGLRATVNPDPKQPLHIQLLLRIHTQDVMLLPAGDRFQGELALTYVMYGPDGQPRASQPLPMQIDMTGPEHDAALKNGIGAGGNVAFPDGVKKVRVIVYDNYSNAVGSLTLTGLGKAGA